MPNQVPPTVEELSSANAEAYGITIGQLVYQKLALEKLVDHLRGQLANAETKISELSFESSQLAKNHVALEDEIHDLQDQVTKLIADGPTAEQIAAQGRAIIQEAQEAQKEKAAPTGPA